MALKRIAGAQPDDPQWYKDALVYQLHVKSFMDSDNDGVGDFPGLISKLDYIADLGVTAVWLLPFYPSPRRDDGYDIADYRGVHPEYGRMADVKRFIDEAHARGLRVITELVVNHTSDEHPWFQRARRAKPGSAHRNFYVWSDNDHAYAGTRIIFCDTEKSNWTWDPVAGAYFWHRFYSHQPDLNFDNPRVLEAVLKVMRYWLDLGIDGLRLDAVPYLIEREGTSNENLPETHDILKQIRAELDRTYPDRMLLAEANMWPEDTQQYFGDGDECHMAFHFPLMPRMYMAIAREDRFPITDIMRQTPAIPENCQWAIFLRNHDELTLEMVTDRERDYLWNFYASERRARINLGIRRRLAPLMERDRRRVELMKSLLLSMPGTPVLYYGDEIGMGDNIHLGDRDGVRTPMQWSPDRNGGFSRADPPRLTLPPIMDPLYGYQAVNVEAAERDPHSLLNWLRRMLAVRREHNAFGRGTLRFIRPQNRKVLAYLREHEGDVILCVANLARTAQAVELDLQEFAGRAPVELVGRTPFPMIGQLPYLLTLPPYGFYWFQLAEEAEGPNWSTANAGLDPEHHTFVLRRDFASLVDGENRAVLERDVLPGYVAARRWFQGKDGGVQRVELRRATALPGTRDLLVGELEVSGAKGSERYLLPLAPAWEDEPPAPFAHNLAMARVRRGARVGLLTDAAFTPHFSRAVLQGLRERSVVPLEGGELRFLPAEGFDLPADLAPQWTGAEQTNSSVVLGGRAVLKLLRKVEPGVHPEAEMTRVLTERGFGNTPPFLGEVVHVPERGEPRTWAVLQGFVLNQGDGWSWTLNYLERGLDELGGDGEASTFESYEPFARRLGQRLAEMHAALAQPSEDPAFAPEVAGKGTAGDWTASVRRQLDSAFDALAARREWSDPALAELAQTLGGRRKALTAAAGELAQRGAGTALTRIHGDLHLGQVLAAGGDVMIIDFEGEPARPLADRRAKSSPMRDVAGVLRSFDYAAAVAAKAHAQRTEAGEARLRAFFAGFVDTASAAFLAGYREGGASADAGPLLDLFLLEKAAYEVAYEAANRPEWIDVPLRGLARIAARLERGGGE